jgi:hypothetical protein
MEPLERRGTHRFSLLLGAIFLELLLSPVLLATQTGYFAERAIGALVLFAALYAVGTRRRALPFFAAAFVALFVATVSGDPRLEAAAVLLRAICLAGALAFVIAHVSRQRDVTFDTIAAASCVYVLLGMIWGDFYYLVEFVFPGSFEIPATLLTGAEGGLRAALIYFSFETLTTIAYGDVHPTTAGAGGVAVSEAIVAQLYLAVMIGRLVALQLASQRDRHSASEK